jgi:hypothetical protein
MSALIKIARAYTNFLAYLSDDTVEIDYEYLWDLICKPNPKLFPNGINLVIIELSRKDITDNVELICPANHYTSAFFDTKKSVILLLKIDNFYEPIYAYKTTEKEITITRSFNLMYKDTMPNIKYVLSLVKKSFNEKCATLPGMPAIYKFQRNILLDKLMHDLPLLNYTIEKQVMNYDSKIIGVVAINNADNSKGFVPCYPSAPKLSGIEDIVYMSDAYADTYENTKAFLTKLYTKSKRQIPCSPYMKVIDDGLIVGILTMTNQFVLIATPTQDTFGADLKIMKNVNYYKVEEMLTARKEEEEEEEEEEVDTERVNYIKKIQLETKFYNVFRTTARYLLGQYQHNDIRREIEEKTNSSQLYLKKLRSVETLLRTLMQDYIQFHTYDEAELLKLDKISNCYNNCANKAYCNTDADTNTCALLIPETNLISQKPNDTFYYGKLADEIIRYSRIKTFIFNPKSVLSFSQLKYNLRENEIILLQSLLTQEYFDNIIAAKVNQYIKYNTYETTQPIIGQTYSNVDEKTFAEPTKVVDLGEEAETAAAASECGTLAKEYIANKYWQAIFPLQSKERVFLSTPINCSFNGILTLIQDSDNNEDIANLSKSALKEILLREYLKLSKTYGSQLLKILRAQGKKILVGQIAKNQLTFEAMILSEDYYATILDVWILAAYYNLPLVFISDTSLMENNSRFMLAHKPAQAEAAGSEAASYYFLKVSAILAQTSPVYTLMLGPEGEMKISGESIRKAEMQTALRSAPEGNNLLTFIKNFSLTEANMRKKILKPVKAPVTQAPVVEAPVVQAPVIIEQAPVIIEQAPIVEAPVTQAPVTQAPVTQAPVTQAPVTQAPLASAAPVVKKLQKKMMIKPKI